MTQFCQVATTMPGEQEALDLARSAVVARLAACVQVGSPIRSVYRWQGTVEQEAEWPVIFKTTMTAYGELAQHIRERHPYDVPEILCLPIVAGDPEYLAWLSGEVAR